MTIDDALEDRVHQIAVARRLSTQGIIQEAVQQYVEREEARDSFVREARGSWSHYQATGRHLTGAEVEAWMGTWGTDDEAGLPECHE